MQKYTLRTAVYKVHGYYTILQVATGPVPKLKLNCVHAHRGAIVFNDRNVHEKFIIFYIRTFSVFIEYVRFTVHACSPTRTAAAIGLYYYYFT